MKNIIIYTTTTCPACTQAKNFLKEKGLDFTEINVASDSSAREYIISKSKARSVPIIQFTRTFDNKEIEEYIVGFIPRAIERFIISREED